MFYDTEEALKGTTLCKFQHGTLSSTKSLHFYLFGS